MINKSETGSIKLFDKEVFSFLFLFLLTVIFVYKTHLFIGIIFQIILLVKFYKSEKNYFWLALLFVMECNPGGLFYRSDLSHNLAIIPLGGEGSIYFWMIFLLLAIIKSTKYPLSNQLFFKNILFLLMFYLVFLFIAFGIPKYAGLIRTLLPWSLFFILPRLLPGAEDMNKFFRLIFISSFLVLFTQIYEITVSEPFARLFGGNVASYTSDVSAFKNKGSLRPLYGIQIPYLAFIGATFLLSVKNKKWSVNALYFVMIISLVSVYVTSTRGWMVSTIAILFFYLLLSAPKTIVFYGKLAAFLLIIIVGIKFSPPVEDLLENAWARYTTVAAIAEGDISAKGTSSRFDVRAPRVIKKFNESQIIGWGYGSEAAKYSDGHVGFHNLMMHTGYLGLSLFIIFWLFFFWKLFQNFLNLNENNPYKNVQLFAIIYLLGLIIINTSSQIFNYFVLFDSGYLLVFILCFGNFIYWEGLKSEVEIRSIPELTSEKIILVTK